MECAGLIEAGGVKDVTHALCDSFSQKKNDVTLFIPYYGCTNLENIRNLKENVAKAVVPICGQMIEVTFSTAEFVNNKVKIVFVNHLAYSEKKAVYVYTSDEEKENPMHVKGMGHTDFHFLDSLFSKAVAAYGQFVPKSKMPDIIHCQDASTALTPAFIEMQKPEFFRNTKSVVTIHNAGPAYHHEFHDVNEALYYTELPWNWITDGMNDNRVEPFLISSRFASLTTVSTFYADEITDPAYNSQTDGLAQIFYDRKIKITGITNGIDYYRYAPEHPEISRLPYSMNPFERKFEGKLKNREFFLKLCRPNEELKLDSRKQKYLENLTKKGYLDSNTSDKKTAFFVYHGRLVWQKGIWILIDALNKILPESDNIKFAVVGQGEKEIENKLQELTVLYPGKFIYFKGYNSCMARLSVAQADFALFPSNFEPCCLEDFIAQIFGTVPIANATGGLQKIIDEETGFLYSPNNPDILAEKIRKAIDLKLNDIETLKNIETWASNYVRDFYSWDHVSEKYLNLFKKLLKN